MENKILSFLLLVLLLFSFTSCVTPYEKARMKAYYEDDDNYITFIGMVRRSHERPDGSGDLQVYIYVKLQRNIIEMSKQKNIIPMIIRLV